MPKDQKSQQQWFQTQVLDWAKIHGRYNFPWQAPHSPYKTWISEIMLQQTQASRVVDFFNRFMNDFPDVETLASAQEDHVFHLWSGLGYYTRAQNLIKSAQIIHRQFDNTIPQSIDALVSLPGIGRSTAGAIRSLGHGLEGSILDGNVRRVLGRYAMIQGKPQSKAMEAAYWDLSSSVTPRIPLEDRAFNQAMMDLGATVCTIRNPKCDSCPLLKRCSAFKHKQTLEYPITMSKYKKQQQLPVKEKRREKRFYLFPIFNDMILLEKRPAIGIWRNLWCPLEFKTQDELAHFTQQQFAGQITLVPMEPIQHQFTHFHLELTPYQAFLSTEQQANGAFEVRESERYLWYNMVAPPDLGLASPIAKLIQQLANATIDETTT